MINEDEIYNGDEDQRHQDMIEATTENAREHEEDDFDGVQKENYRRERDAGDYVDDGSE